MLLLLHVLVILQYATDVVACNRDPNTDMVETLDAWNSAVWRRTTVDTNSDVVKFSSNYIDGRISCRCVHVIKILITVININTSTTVVLLVLQRRLHQLIPFMI